MHDKDTIDIVAIEMDARRLRAKATRDAFAALGAWIAARFSSKALPNKA